MKKLVTILISVCFFVIALSSFGQTTGGSTPIWYSPSGTTNGVQLDATQGIKLNGTATQWMDLTVSATQTRVTPATSLPAFSTDSVALLFVSDADSSERAYYSFQFNHGFKPLSKISPHVHWIQHNIADTTWNIKIKYRIHPIGKQSGTWKWAKAYKRYSLTFTASPFHQIAEFPDITMTNCYESSVMDVVLYRYDATGLATVYVKQFDLHFEIEKMGTPNEYPVIP